MRADSVITADGIKTEMIRRPLDKEVCIIDWISVTFQASTLDDQRTKGHLTAESRQSEIISNFSPLLANIFGFAIDFENDSGRNFYTRSYTLEHDAGYVCIGGQNDTIMLCINGTGCTYGKVGWEEDLNAWLVLFANKAKITRIDLAHDDLYGDYTNLNWFDNQHTIGGFNQGGPSPTCEHRGNWKQPNGKGRTMYIGSRQSSKFCRIYEKGRQLGDPTSEWLRIEVEYKSRDIYIPLDVLLKPSEFFICSYPCFDVFNFEGKLNKFEVIDKQDLMSWDNSIQLVKTQYGRYIKFFRKVINDDSKLLDMLTDISNNKPPKRIDPLTIPKLTH